MKAAALAAANRRLRKIVEVEHRRARAALDRHPQRQQHGRGGQPDDHDRVVPAAEPATGDAEHEPGEPDDEREVPSTS